jgi:O-antigen/teichoic acid export membrane protein
VIGRVSNLVRRWFRLTSFGLIEQILLSGINFAYTAMMAHYLGAHDFGWMSIGWAVVLFMEAGSNGLFGDGIASSARRLPVRRQRDFRGVLLLHSTCYSGIILLISLVAWPIAVERGFHEALIIPAAGLSYFCLRAQNAMRRLFYLEGRRREAAAAAFVYVVCISVAVFAAKHAPVAASPALALIIPALASAISALFLFSLQRILPISRPRPLLVYWGMRRLWRTGRWLFAASTMSSLGNYGFIVIIGAMMGVEASGTLRVVNTLSVPPFQFCIVLLSILVPRITALPRGDLASRQGKIALGATGLFLAATLPYAVIITLSSPWLLPAMFTSSAKNVTMITTAIYTFGYAVESIRLGCNAVLLARGETRIVTIGQTLALITAFALVPAATFMGINYVVFAITFANNVNTVVVGVAFYRKAWAVRAAEGRRRSGFDTQVVGG